MSAAAVRAGAERAVRLIRPDDDAASVVEVVGGKAAALARLAIAGLRVPEWAVIPAGALDDQLRASSADCRVRHVLDRLSRGEMSAEAAARDLDLDLAPGESLRVAIATALDAIGPGPYAVRSSAPDEDGVRLSFAGQFDTVLGPRDLDEVCAAVERCWRSALGSRALDYRRRNGSLESATRLAVVVQRLVAGEVSGVLFTRGPLGDDPTCMHASATWGLGELLVSGEGDADEYVIARDGREVSARTANKASRSVATAGGSRMEAVDEPLRAARTLDAVSLAALAGVGRAIVEAEGGERDVEWTIAGGELFVLQARPITGAPVARGRRIVWDNSNIQESYSGVTTPLTFSFASAAYASVYEQTMRAVGLPERTIAAHRPLLRGLLGLIRGRVYYNLENWYRGLLLLPAFGRNKADMERMMGVEEPVDFVADDAPGAWGRLRRAPTMLRTMARLLFRFARLRRDVPRFLAEFEAGLASVPRGSLGEESLGSLMDALDRLRERCVERWATPIVNDFHVMMTSGRLRRIVERAAPGAADRLMPALLAGAGGEASAGSSALFLRIAELARADERLRAALDGGDAAAALGRARAASPAFAALEAELYARWGDRCIGELKLESRPLADDPAFVVGVLRSYLDGAAPSPAEVAARVEAARVEAMAAVERSLSALARRRFRRALSAARRGVRDREAMRLARTRMFGAHRAVYRAIGARLASAGHLDAADDVLYLTTDEIRGWWDGTAASADLGAVARARRVEFAAYEGDAPPNRVVTYGAPHEHRFASSRDAVAAGRVLRGLGCSAGVAVGRVRVVTGPTSDLALAGQVLVAPRTDPGWAPLFPGAAAVVVERGSLLSHSAVLARELGLPAVVGIPGVVATLRDGELVRVDGAAGTVERLEER